MDLKKVGIIQKRESEEAQRIAAELAEWFAGRQVSTVIDSIAGDMDLLVILGGDGTLLHVAEEASRYKIPVVGVNLGGLGFLTEISVDECYATMDAIMVGAVHIEDRMMFKVRLRAGEETGSWQYALNDVVISKGNVDRLVYLSTWADDEYITTYKADGLIFSTPTGSTAYNLSAGGPIVHPDQHSFLVTPICPFMLESRPVLLPSKVRLKTKLDGCVNDVKVIVDGQFSWEMKENDLLEVEVSDRLLRLIGSPKKGYFEILRNKLNWGGRSMPSPDPEDCRKDNQE